MGSWISPKDRLPPQGKKVLLFYNGDCWVGQRFQNYWVPLPFTDSKFSRIDAPDLWKDIEMPEGYSGKIRAEINGVKMDIDTLEASHPDAMEHLVKMTITPHFNK